MATKAAISQLPVSGVNSPAFSDTYNFPVQSYLSSTLYQKALLAQPMGGLIISKQDKQVGGYWLANAPWSETPIAVKLTKGDKGGGASPVVVLKPGQIFMPTGASGRFGAFAYGLPFGWLGGGLATIVVGQTHDADVAWTGNPEVMFHQFRYKILASNVVPASPTLDWPSRLPWINAIQGANSVAQKGSPIFSVVPTRVVLRLRQSALAGPATVRMLARGFNQFDLDTDGTTVLTADKSFSDVSFPADLTGVAGYPVTVLDRSNPIVTLGGADAGGVDFIDVGATSVAAVEIDVQRWGTL